MDRPRLSLARKDWLMARVPGDHSLILSSLILLIQLSSDCAVPRHHNRTAGSTRVREGFDGGTTFGENFGESFCAKRPGGGERGADLYLGTRRTTRGTRSGRGAGPAGSGLDPHDSELSEPHQCS